MDWYPSLPYNELPLLPPTTEIETREILKLCLEARISLEHLKMIIKNSDYEDAIETVLPVLETKYNCEIENIKTKHQDLFGLNEETEEYYPSLSQTIKCKHALTKGKEGVANSCISNRLAELICSTVNGESTEIRLGAGSSLVRAGTLIPIYTPPSGQEVLASKLANWEEFLNCQDVFDPLIAMAVAHYQFEAMRPFIEGNGRTGRILNQVFLVQSKVIDGPYLCLCRYINLNKARYFTYLLNVTKNGDWHNWIQFMLEAVRESAIWTARKAGQINDYLCRLNQAMEADRELEKICSVPLIQMLGRHPCLRIKDIVHSGLVQRKTASKYLNLLVRKGLFSKDHTSKGQLFVNRKYLQILSSD